MNVLDKIISFIDPSSGRKRLQNRMAVQMIDKSLRKYEAASTGRRTSGWASSPTSTNLEISTALTKLRERSKELARNNPYARNAIKRIANNVVGTGIIPTPLNAGAQEDKIKQLWKDWAESTDCDYAEQFDFYGLQKLIMRCVVKNGECIVRRIKTKYEKGKIPIQLQVMEPDFIDSNKTWMDLAGGGYIINGVEFDKNGKIVAYFLFPRHPLEHFNIQSARIPAEDILHIYEVEDPGQVRGIPFGTSSMLRQKDFDDYEDAQLVRQKIAACFSVFVTENENLSPIQDEDKAHLEKVEPGIIEHLPPGKQVTFASPPAAEGYDAYSRQVLQAISAGYGISYEALTNDLSHVNFSSGRMGWIEFQRNIEDWQWMMLIPQFCDKAWKWFIKAAEIAGSVREDAHIKASWTCPRREMIDPVKETEALSELVRNGFESWHDAVKSLGENPEEKLAQMIKDAKAFDKSGLRPACDPRFDAGDKPPAPKGKQ